MINLLSSWFAPGPLFGWACVLFLALIPIIWFRARASRRRATVRFSSLATVRVVGSTWAVRTRFLLPLLRTLAIIALITALARPQSAGEYRDTGEGIAIQMVLDISGSMAADDFLIDGHAVRRLDAVKRVFEEFVLGKASLGGRGNDLIGMSTFAMFTDMSCPLTRDHGGLIDLLRATEIPGWVDGREVRQSREAGNTALGDAIALATDILRRAGEQAVAGFPGAEAAKSRVMILLTDGADNPADFAEQTSPDPREAAKVAATLGIKIYTIGAVGADRRGRRSLSAPPRSEVDERTLKEIATVTGGKYFRATDADSLVTIYDEIDQRERRKTGERKFRDNIRAARIAMLAALGMLMVGLLLANTKYRTAP